MSVVDQAAKDGLSSDYTTALISGTETAGVYLAYTKEADSLPVSLTYVGIGKPCRDANKRLTVDQPWYPLENGREAEVCAAEDTDSRYV